MKKFKTLLAVSVTAALAVTAGMTAMAEDPGFTGEGSIAYIVTGLGDMSFNDSGEVGMNTLRAAGYDVKTVETGDDAAGYLDTMYDLLDTDFLPIVCPIGLDDDFNTYNINADDAACAIARAVQAEKLAFLTDIEGVYRDYDDKDSLISELTVSEARELLQDGGIQGGMLPKLNNCIDAIENGVSRVHILDGRIAHCLLLEIFTNKGIGTAILHEKEERYYNE